MNYVIFILFSISSLTATAYFDSSINTQARSHAAALAITGTTGFNYKIWGQENETVFYGYVRPYLQASLSPSQYSGRFGVEFFPVSFIGIDVKKAYGHRYVKIMNQDCDSNLCLGEYNYTDVSTQLYLGYKNYFSSLRWTRTFLDSVEDQSRPRLDAGSLVQVSSGTDVADYFTLILGEKGNWLFKGTDVGLLFQDNFFRETKQRQTAGYIFTQATLESLGWKKSGSVSLAMGYFSSSLATTELSLYTSLNYDFGPKGLGFGK